MAIGQILNVLKKADDAVRIVQLRAGHESGPFVGWVGQIRSGRVGFYLAPRVGSGQICMIVNSRRMLHCWSDDV